MKPRRDRGSVTLWVLGLSVLILGFGGVALDFWRALAVQRELAAIADAASVAAASGINEEVYRADGRVLLDATIAEGLGLELIAAQGRDLDSYRVTVSADGSSVDVEVLDDVPAAFVGFFTAGEDGLTVRARSTAEPRLVP